MAEAITAEAALRSVQKARQKSTKADQAATDAYAEFVEAGKAARRAGVPVSDIASVIGLSRQQAHRLFGAERPAYAAVSA